MSEDRLTGLALSIHRDRKIDYEDVLTRFAQQHPWRMELGNVILDDCLWNIGPISINLMLHHCLIIRILSTPHCKLWGTLHGNLMFRED